MKQTRQERIATSKRKDIQKESNIQTERQKCRKARMKKDVMLNRL